ncbi:MAG: CoA ester lyase [Chloroflexi bacterium]|nr:CoA ester lyase [Chloroflexota bacterium]
MDIFFRSLHFIPGNRQDMLTKSATLPADVLVPDMEDSVPEGQKQQARELIKSMAPTLAQKGQLVMPRINALNTGLAHEDLAAIVSPQVYGVTVGKVESPWEIQELSKILESLERKAGLPVGHTKLVPWLENAKAVLNAHAIAAASPRIAGVAFGAEDFTDSMGVERTDGGTELAYARAAVAVAARAADMLAIDTPYVNFRDTDGLAREIRAVLPFGFKAKFSIHPVQVEVINRLFSPSEESIAYARKVVAVWDEAAAKGIGAIALDGKMIDVPVVKRARNLLALADAMAKRG